MTRRRTISMGGPKAPADDQGVPDAAHAGQPTKRTRDQEPWAEAFEFARLVPVSETMIGSCRVLVVQARDVHVFLNPGRDFPTWFSDQVSACSLSAGSDFVSCTRSTTESTQVGRPRVDHPLTLHAAKKIAMAAKGRRGNVIREYFLEQERRPLAGEPPLAGEAAATSLPAPASTEDVTGRTLTPMEAATRLPTASARHRAMSAAMYHSLAEYLAWVGIKPQNVNAAAGYFEDEVMYEAMLDTSGFGYARNELTARWVFSRRMLDAWWDLRGGEILRANEYNNSYFACYRRGIEPPK